MRFKPAGGVAVALAGLALAGCATQGGHGTLAKNRNSHANSNPTVETAQTTKPQQPVSDLWVRIRDELQFDDNKNRPAVKQWVQFYASHQDHLLRALRRARPFLWHIVKSLDGRDMPDDLALLPIVESAFNPLAESYARAVGLWQFIPATANRFGLANDWWHDGRRDVLSSTAAALEYLQWLHNRFGDWLLALAAYNAGENRIGRAIAEAKSNGTPTDFWHLDLPAETANYVPQLLALEIILKAPEQYALQWPKLPNQPLTVPVKLPQQVELKVAADMMEIPEQTLRDLNPGCKRWATRPHGKRALLVPIRRADMLRTALAAADPSDLVRWQSHRVRRGDNLSRIAQTYGTTTRRLKTINDLTGSVIHPGDKLLIPHGHTAVAGGGHRRSAPRREIRIRSGDSLWAIAHRNGVSVTGLRRWNHLSRHAILHPGQKLVLHGGHPAFKYHVVEGDSLWSIAQRFDVHVSAVRNWNRLAHDTVLHPGQKLTIRGASTRKTVLYRVHRGDSLWSIASRFSVNVAQLQRWNRLGRGRPIHPGQKLRIIVDANSS